jgi:preprotein translocase subunit SecG
MVVLNIFHVLIAIAMIAFVLVQRGAGATAGAAFGSGASGTVFGARGAGTFLSKSTWVLATLFCAISLTIAVLVSRTHAPDESALGVVSAPAAASQPAEEVPAMTPPAAMESGQQADMPVVPASEGDNGGAGTMQQQAADDLPALDGTAAETTEGNQGATAGGQDSDDS